MITLLTASLPQRAEMLAENIASVAAQTRKPDFHRIGVDHNREGAAAIFNQLAQNTNTEWLTFLDDDDLIDPEHLEVMLSAAEPEDDVVFTGCRSTGGSFEQYNVPFYPAMLERLSIVPITAMVRTSWFKKVGGFRTESGYDWMLWRRLCGAGAKFKQVNQITFTYRFHGKNQSREGTE